MTALGESTYEAVFDHGNDGYGVWFDGMVREDPMYKQFWKGTGLRPIFVRIEEDRIVISKQIDRPHLTQPMSGQEDAGDEVEIDLGEPTDEDVVYTQEEAARLFASELGEGESPEAAGADADSTEEDAPAPTRRRVARRATTEDADEAPAAPRRTRARRTTTASDADTTSDDAG